MLLDAGADAAPWDNHGRMPLHWASEGFVTISRMLLDAGAPAESSGDLETPLLLAASAGEEKIVRMLLDAGANLAVKDALGRTPLFVAAMCEDGAENPTLRMLLEAGARVSVRTDAVFHGFLHSAAAGRQPLHCAAGCASVDSVRMLLDARADPSAHDDFGTTPLHDSVGAPFEEEIVRLLLAAGADASAKDQHGNTGLPSILNPKP